MSMIAHYKINEGSGTVLSDALGNKSDISLFNMDNSNWVTWYKAGELALRFNGVDETGLSLLPDNYPDVISMLIRHKPNVGAAGDGLISIGDASVAGFAHAIGTPLAQQQAYDGTILSGNTTGLNDGSWHMTGITHAADDTVKLYLDGVPDGSASSVRADWTSAGGFTCFGAIWVGIIGLEFNGDIGEVAIWNHVLSDEEVLDFYNDKPANNVYEGNILLTTDLVNTLV